MGISEDPPVTEDPSVTDGPPVTAGPPVTEGPPVTDVPPVTAPSLRYVVGTSEYSMTVIYYTLLMASITF